MTERRCTLALALALGASAAALAAPSPEAAGAEGGYCDFVRGVAGAEAALRLYPEVLASAGVVNAGEAQDAQGIPFDSPALRLSAGLGYDVVGLYQAAALRRREGAECRCHRAREQLEAALRAGEGIGAAAALTARAAVLERALPRGEELLAGVRTEVREGRATLEELNALQLRVDALRELAHQTALAREALAAWPAPAAVPLPVLLASFREADAAVEDASGDLRQSAAWRVQLRGGYERLVDRPQEVPLFGVLTVSFNLGRLAQPAANARAARGRQRASHEDVEGVARRAQALLHQLQAARAQEQRRLSELGVLSTDLEAQLKQVSALPTAQVRRYRGFLWAELARLQAEEAFLRAHVAALASFLEGAPP